LFCYRDRVYVKPITSESGMYLYVDSVTDDDGGNYRCQALINEAEVATRSYEVVIQGK